ncbi:hypothetical protein ABEY43_07165 [Priestia megaterium]
MELIKQKQYEELTFAYDLDEDYNVTAKHREDMVEKGYRPVNTYLKADDHVKYIRRIHTYRKEI